MADVLIVCVREDKSQAKALADMFERAGFTVGGAPSNDAALRSCGATVVMWSQAAIRSRPFLDASQRAVNAGKAILACLIDPPPADSVSNSPAFDLGDWDGDPEDPNLDPLFFAVDRMVATARADAGYDAPARQERAPERARSKAPTNPSYARSPYEPPPRAEPRHEPRAPVQPSSYQSRPVSSPRMEPPRAPAPRHDDYEPRPDPLGSEAEHWRAIRHSRTPADFLEYLSKYGQDGSFSELAEIRLKELQGGRATPAARELARPAAPVSAPRIPREERMPERPLERARTREMDRDTPTLRSTERRAERPPAHVREGGGGGIAKALFAVVLLGGVALAGGLYFGLNQQGPTEVSENRAADSASTTMHAAPSADKSVSYEEAALDPPQQIETGREAPRGGPDLPRTPAPRAAATPQPAPQHASPDARDLNAAAMSGPVPLTPAQQAPAPLPTVFVEPVPTVSFTPPAATPQPARPAGRVSWATQPSAARIAALYPSRAARIGQGGSAQLDCTVRPDFGLSCTIANETPQGAGFGQAALRAAAFFRVNPSLSNGYNATGSRTSVTIRFQSQ